MSEYVFRDAPGFGCDMDELMDGGRETVGDYFASNANDHYGTLHEEIVRCRDCVYFKSETDIFPALCRLWLPRNLSKQYGIEPDGFCAWGERRKDA